MPRWVPETEKAVRSVLLCDLIWYRSSAGFPALSSGIEQSFLSFCFMSQTRFVRRACTWNARKRHSIRSSLEPGIPEQSKGFGAMKTFFFVRFVSLNTSRETARPDLCSRSLISRRVASRENAARHAHTSRISMQSTSTREKALKYGIDALVEDHVKSGTNICIGSGSKDITIPLLDAAALSVGAEGLIDVAFVATDESTAALMEERNLPSDMAVNFKRSLDVFIASATMVDQSCNVVLDSTDFAADKFAAELADQVVVIVHEDDFEKSRKGIQSLPVQLCPFLPDLAAKSLCAKSLMDVGVRGCTLRPDESNIADVSLATDAITRFAAEELERIPAVLSHGFLPNSSKMTVVLATNDFQPVDLTSTLHSLANVSAEDRRTRLTREKREDLLRSLGAEWRLIEGQHEALLRSFSFPNAGQAQAFVRYVHHVSSQAWHHPEIKESYNRVQICLTTYDAGGLSQLDWLFARELSRVFSKLAPGKSSVS